MTATTTVAATQSRRESRRVPSDLFSYLGIVVMTILIVVIVSIGIVGMHRIQNAGEEIVQDRLEKIRLVQTMGTAARERTVLLQRMIMIDDPFKRDELTLEYNINGSRFANARTTLLKNELSPEENAILDRQGAVSRSAVPLQNQIVDLIAENEEDKAARMLTQQAIPLQDEVLKALSELMEYQTTAAYGAVNQTRQAFERGRTFTVAMAVTAVGIALVLVWLVSKAARQRRDYYEQVKAANRAKTSFLAKMSHEIRTPLTAIIGFAELSLDGDQGPDERIGALRTIHNSGKHLLKIINDVLDLSKIEADKFNIEKESCSLFQILEDISALVQMQAAGKGLTFGVNYQFPLPRHIDTDPLRLKQIIINLCGNSIKFTDKGFVYINVSYERVTEFLIIEVADSGIGMSPDDTGRLFQEFQQVDAGINRKYGGTGLGLAVSQKLAALLGGYITVTSEKGVGSKFRVMIKQPEDTRQLIYALREIELSSKESRATLTSEAAQFTGHVLLVEDTPQIRDLVSMYLRRAGVRVSAVENGAQALESIAQTPFDLVLMDIQMPVMDGLTAISELRARKCVIPIVALTANAMREDQESYRAAGFADVLAKPVDRLRLVQVLERYLSKAAVADEGPIRATLGDDDPELRQLITAFVAKLPEYWVPIERAAHEGNWPYVHELAHKLKGLGGGMGYPVISDIAASILFQLKAENFDAVAEHIERLGKTVARIRVPAPLRDELPQESVRYAGHA